MAVDPVELYGLFAKVTVKQQLTPAEREVFASASDELRNDGPLIDLVMEATEKLGMDLLLDDAGLRAMAGILDRIAAGRVGEALSMAELFHEVALLSTDENR